MNYYSYIVARDFGFAPNPFGGYCTLATCKPGIRKGAQVGDWVIGTGAKKRGVSKQLIYAMEVSEKISYNDYWEDPRFQYKKPLINGSLVQLYGDNIYSLDNTTNQWCQLNSHHSHEDGSPNQHNLKRDVKGQFVLVSTHFYYFGSASIELPKKFKDKICIPGVGYKKVPESKGQAFIKWLSENYSPGRLANPIQFGGKFERYDGVS